MSHWPPSPLAAAQHAKRHSSCPWTFVRSWNQLCSCRTRWSSGGAGAPDAARHGEPRVAGDADQLYAVGQLGRGGLALVQLPVPAAHHPQTLAATLRHGHAPLPLRTALTGNARLFIPSAGTTLEMCSGAAPKRAADPTHLPLSTTTNTPLQTWYSAACPGAWGSCWHARPTAGAGRRHAVQNKGLRIQL